MTIDGKAKHSGERTRTMFIGVRFSGSGSPVCFATQNAFV